jgi:transcriptional regulator with XRE-family HTH domain
MRQPAKTDGDIPQDGFPRRLRQAISGFGSVTALAQAIDRSDGAVRKWLRGVAEPNVTNLRAISAATGVSIEWLVTGQGDSRLSPKGVHEAVPVYRADAPSRMDNALLESVMETVDEELLRRGVQIAATKRSAMVVTLYSLFRESQNIDQEAVTRLVRLAG